MLDLEYLKSLSPDAAKDYLTTQLQGGLGEYVSTATADPLRPVFVGEGGGMEGGYADSDLGYYPSLGKGINVVPGYEGYAYFSEYDSPSPDAKRNYTAVIPGVEGTPAYLAEFGQDGKLVGVGRQPENDWWEQEVGPFGLQLGALLPLAGAAAGSYFAPAAAEGAAPMVSGGGPQSLIGGSGTDLLGGEILKDTAGLDKLIFQSAAKDAAIQAGLSGELAAMAGEVAGGLAGSGLALDAAIASGLEAAGAAAATGAVGTAGSIIGGGGAITAGLTGAAGGLTGLDALTAGAKDLWNTGKDLYKTVAPVASAGKKLYDAVTGSGSGSGSGTSGGLLGGLGGIGGILGLALLMAQLRKDRNAPAANATPVIPRLRSRVEQKPFTLDAQGNKQAPLAYFGQPVYYAAGGGIGGLAAGGQASRAVRGPGDGVSDSIPASINGEEPAALADGEFVIDARTVAELGNGSTEAGTRKLEAMVNRVHHARAKARRGEDSGADRHMPA